MQDIKGYDRSIQELLSSRSYSIEYYQREYEWGKKQLQELVDDLTECFLSSYEPGHDSKMVANYNHYFLGSVVVSEHGATRQVVDGQQRLTSLLILLIYLNNLQCNIKQKVIIDHLIYTDEFGEKKFKLDVPERNDCMEGFFTETPFTLPENASQSVRNLVNRYQDLEDIFPKELQEEALPLFIYWLIHKVKLIEIVAFQDEDAYMIFETMNDRGLSLSPTDMLKGFLLANIDDLTKRNEAEMQIKEMIYALEKHGKETESDFFKTWLRSQYATEIRERKKDAKPKDFDLMGTEYHRWIRNQAEQIGLKSNDDFYQFIMKKLRYFGDLYLKLLDASKSITPGLESIRFNSDVGFTLQHHVILAAADPSDDSDVSIAKARLVSVFLDIWLNLRIWNSKSINYTTMQYAVFLVMKNIRRKSLEEIRTILHARLSKELEEINFMTIPRLKKSKTKNIHIHLARFADWLERESGEPGHYEDYFQPGQNVYEVEHIFANHYDHYQKQFHQMADFDYARNKIGALLLLRKKDNASLSDMTYAQKLPHYLKGNILAQSLHGSAYQNNPGFVQTINKHNLPFKPHQEFTRDDIELRSKLYSSLAELVWSLDRLNVK